jgi:hypothetical protein
MQFRLKLWKIKNADEPLSYATIFKQALRKVKNIKEIYMKDGRPRYKQHKKIYCFQHLVVYTGTQMRPSILHSSAQTTVDRNICRE